MVAACSDDVSLSWATAAVTSLALTLNLRLERFFNFITLRSNVSFLFGLTLPKMMTFFRPLAAEAAKSGGAVGVTATARTVAGSGKIGVIVASMN
jgi:hypothetical protein